MLERITSDGGTLSLVFVPDCVCVGVSDSEPDRVEECVVVRVGTVVGVEVGESVWEVVSVAEVVGVVVLVGERV